MCFATDQENVFRDRAHDGRDRRFLKRVGANCMRRNLTADHHDRHRIGHAVTHRCNGIGRARTGGNHDDPHLAAGARVTRSHEPRALLVGWHNQGDWRGAIGLPVAVVITENGVVGRQYRAAAVAENRVYAFVRKNLDDHIGAAHHRIGKRMFAGLGGDTAIRHELFELAIGIGIFGECLLIFVALQYSGNQASICRQRSAG